MASNITEITTSIAAKCTCGRFLTIEYTKYPTPHDYTLDVTLKIKPCPVCTRAYFERGRVKGYGEGHGAGYENGYEAGYENGQVARRG